MCGYVVEMVNMVCCIFVIDVVDLKVYYDGKFLLVYDVVILWIGVSMMFYGMVVLC